MPTSPPTTGAASDGGLTADSGTAASDTGPSVPPPPAVSCDTPPAIPFPVQTLPNLVKGDEIAFDTTGDMLSFDRNDIVRVTGTNNQLEVVARNAVGNGGGALNVLPDGELLLADYDRNMVVRIDSAGQRDNLQMSVHSPMKMVPGPGNTYYVSSQDGSISRVDVASGRSTVIATSHYRFDGLAFSADYHTLYVGSDDDNSIVAFPVSGDGTLGTPTTFASNVSRPRALVTDECNRLYVIGAEDGNLRRVDADGTVTIVVDNKNAHDIWSLAFGSGKQGWSDHALYALDYQTGDLLEINISAGAPPAPPATVTTDPGNNGGGNGNGNSGSGNGNSGNGNGGNGNSGNGNPGGGFGGRR